MGGAIGNALTEKTQFKSRLWHIAGRGSGQVDFQPFWEP